MRDGVR